MDLMVALSVLLLLTVLVTVFFKQFFLPKKINETAFSHLSEEDRWLLKKAPEVDVHRYRKYPLIVGLFVTLLFAVVMVEYKTYAVTEMIKKVDVSKVFEEMLDIPITEMPPPEPPKAKTSMVMEVVKDEELIEEKEMPIEEPLEEEEFFEEIEEVEIEEEEVAPQIHVRVEQNAEPDGGMQVFHARLMTKIGESISASGTDGYSSGVVYLQFVVMEDGSISNLTVAKGIHPKIDEMVKRDFKSTSGRWAPGRIQGRPVRQQKTFPVRIKFD